ncbi:MAG TPA: sensor histidine kinase [Acidimicrobiia bacterium]|nr:sensor histidine kinase [Acidimicrobiia bacterium]
MTLLPIALSRTELNAKQLDHVLRLAGTWRPLADLSFSDLLLLAPIAEEAGHRFVVLAQVRPTTGQTIYPTDMVGTIVDEVERPLLMRSLRTGEIVENDTPAIGTKERVRVQCIPVRCDEEIVALVTRDLSMTSSRRPGELERTYQETFERFARMISQGSFPFAREEIELETSPRVGDGVIIIDDETRVKFASPNAVSSMHRMGIHAYANGQLLREVGFDDAAPHAALNASLPVTEELERGDVSVLLRVLPMLESGRPIGAIMMIRDVTDLRRRDRMLLSKDATIREIHHRVKNNLQTIASLLRLQARRLGSPEARGALAESERRIRSIAIVHETLSRDAGDVVHVGEILRPLVRVVEESVASPDRTIHFNVEGDAGDLPGEVATPLAVVLNELMQNAVDHAFPDRHEGQVTVRLARSEDHVLVDVVDDGVGLPPGFSLDGSRGLGLSIVHALVTGELDGAIEMRDGDGTTVHVQVPIAMPRVEL